MSSSITYTILAGPNQQPLTVLRDTLEKSPVIRDWISDPTTISPSLVHQGALNLAECDLDVVTTVIKWLGKSSNLPAARRLEYALQDVALGGDGQDAVFYVKMYKLGLCLALEDLCDALLLSLRRRTYNVQIFIDVALCAEQARLIDEKRFRNWTIDYITQNSEKLMESPVLRGTIDSGGAVAWRLFSLLMSSLSQCRQDTVSPAEKTDDTATLRTPSISPSDIFYEFFTRHSSASVRRASIPRESEYPEVPNRKRAKLNHDDSPGSRKRSYNASVEDASDSS